MRYGFLFFHVLTVVFIAAVVFSGKGCSAAEISEDYLIGPEDVLEITVWDNENLSSKVAVSLEGFINYQLIGKVKTAGLSAAELGKKITGLLADGYIINPQVMVRVIEYKSQKIFIIGEANRPGTYYLTKKTTLVEAVAMAGGPTKDADREVVVVRPRKTKTVQVLAS